MNISDLRTNEQSENCFMDMEQAKAILQSEVGDFFDLEVFKDIVESFLIVTIPENETKYIYYTDLEICKRLLYLNTHINVSELNKIGYHGSFLVRRLKISEDTYVICDINKVIPVFVRNIVLRKWNNLEVCPVTRIELLGITVITTNLEIRTYIENAIYRKTKLDTIKHSSFANSGSYMGTKKELIGFIVESIFPYTNYNTIFLDIMCGSGVVSNALAQMGKVYASDAQKFCQLFAKIQGVRGL